MKLKVEVIDYYEDQLDYNIIINRKDYFLIEFLTNLKCLKSDNVLFIYHNNSFIYHMVDLSNCNPLKWSIHVKQLADDKLAVIGIKKPTIIKKIINYIKKL